MKKFGVGAGDRFIIGSYLSLSNQVSLVWSGTGITASVRTSGGSVSTSGTQNSSGWVHCAMVYDGSQSPDGLKLYIDGELDSSANVGLPVWILILSLILRLESLAMLILILVLTVKLVMLDFFPKLCLQLKYNLFTILKTLILD